MLGINKWILHGANKSRAFRHRDERDFPAIYFFSSVLKPLVFLIPRNIVLFGKRFFPYSSSILSLLLSGLIFYLSLYPSFSVRTLSLSQIYILITRPAELRKINNATIGSTTLCLLLGLSISSYWFISLTPATLLLQTNSYHFGQFEQKKNGFSRISWLRGPEADYDAISRRDSISPD